MRRHNQLAAAALQNRPTTASILRNSVSAFAICAATWSFPALAQEADPATSDTDTPTSDSSTPAEPDDGDTGTPPGEEGQPTPDDTIVVHGIRGALATSQDLKRNAETFVDAITAEDIGALADRSITEALQRVPGVAISRFAAAVDPDHFSIEGSGVTVRGLNFVRSELNGRDTFTANNGRGLSFADVPSEMVGAVVVHKNQSADLIEGGVAGTVNLVTRKPFDSQDRVIAGSAEATYGDFRQGWAPNVTATLSDRWDTGAGEFGLLVSGVYSELKSRSDGIQASSFQPRTDLVPGETLYAPEGVAFRTQDANRLRIGSAAAAQWANPDNTMVATAQYLRSEARQAWTEHAVEVATDNVGDNAFYFLPGTEWGYDEDGIITHGTITAPTGWRSDQFSSDPRTPIYGLQSNNIFRDHETTNVVQDIGFNFKYTPTDRWSFQFDYQRVDATVEVFDVTMWGSTFQNVEFDFRPDIPTATFLPPSADGTVVDCTAAPSNTCPTYFNPGHESFEDPYNSFWRSAMDHIEDSVGVENAYRFDGEYQVDNGWAESIRFGVRYNQRNQTTRYTTYNWGSLSEIWGSGGPVWFDDPVNGDPNTPGGEPTYTETELFYFDNFMRGETGVPVVVPFYSGSMLDEYDSFAEFAYAIRDEWGGGSWERLDDPVRGEHSSPGSPFLPREIHKVEEKTWAGYAMLRFGKDLPTGNRVSGNFGVRVVNTSAFARGQLGYLLYDFVTYDDDCIPENPDEIPQGFCALPPDLQDRIRNFATSETVEDNVTHTYLRFLPSFNLKVELEEDLLFRFGYSRNMRRPDIGLTRNTLSIDDYLINNQYQNPLFQIQSGNANLDPMKSDSFDMSLEWYFSEKVGSLTLSGFYKRLEDVITNGIEYADFTAGGETFEVQWVRPVNSDELGTIRGFELAYQQTYDFLPAPFDGLGMQGSFTYIDSQGVPQSTLRSTETDPTDDTPEFVDTSELPLVNMSKYNTNVAVFYEKGPIALRVAHSWRSEFLLTTRDVITPFFPIMHEATGQLDASAFYSINDNLKVGIQAVNLLDETLKTSQIVNSDLLQAPRSWFKNDRRFNFIVRFNY